MKEVAWGCGQLLCFHVKVMSADIIKLRFFAVRRSGGVADTKRININNKN
jgi:hypothetical protein